MTTQPLPGSRTEFVDHRLAGRLVAAPDGRTGVLKAVLLKRDSHTLLVHSRTAHLLDDWGVEWKMTDPQALRPVDQACGEEMQR
ncbi:hypothetical protein AB0C77_12700 [Streptomyces sp. NPDC048629]|uniref:hypothetical protein n=1 Tax=Streptomyces sp. NPDC048629 TaxID=3154824 RepID=UPI0034264D79